MSTAPVYNPPPIFAYAPERPAPLWARMLGKRHHDSSYRFRWGELSVRGVGFAFELHHYDEPGFTFSFLWPRFYFRLPGWRWIRKIYPQGYDIERSYGFSLWLTGEFAFDLFWHWGGRCRIFHPPWGWSLYSYEYLGEDGAWYGRDADPEHYSRRLGGRRGPLPPEGPPAWSAVYPYHYMLSDGEVQHVDAKVKRQRSVQTWKLFGIPLRCRRGESIDIQFSDEVGSERGSWKGGVLGCSYEMTPGEGPFQTLRRMQRRRSFDR